MLYVISLKWVRPFVFCNISRELPFHGLPDTYPVQGVCHVHVPMLYNDNCNGNVVYHTLVKYYLYTYMLPVQVQRRATLVSPGTCQGAKWWDSAKSKHNFVVVIFPSAAASSRMFSQLQLQLKLGRRMGGERRKLQRKSVKKLWLRLSDKGGGKVLKTMCKLIICLVS